MDEALRSPDRCLAGHGVYARDGHGFGVNCPDHVPATYQAGRLRMTCQVSEDTGKKTTASDGFAAPGKVTAKHLKLADDPRPIRRLVLNVLRRAKPRVRKHSRIG